MRGVLVPTLTLMAALLAPSTCGALWSVSNTGDWPKSWPAQLEPLRPQSRTLHDVPHSVH